MLMISDLLVAQLVNHLKRQPFDDVHLFMQQLTSLQRAPTPPAPNPSTEGTRS